MGERVGGRVGGWKTAWDRGKVGGRPHHIHGRDDIGLDVLGNDLIDALVELSCAC